MLKFPIIYPLSSKNSDIIESSYSKMKHSNDDANDHGHGQGKLFIFPSISDCLKNETKSNNNKSNEEIQKQNEDQDKEESLNYMKLEKKNKKKDEKLLTFDVDSLILQTYLRLLNVPHTVETCIQHGISPSGHLPMYAVDVHTGSSAAVTTGSHIDDTTIEKKSIGSQSHGSNVKYLSYQETLNNLDTYFSRKAEKTTIQDNTYLFSSAADVTIENDEENKENLRKQDIYAFATFLDTHLRLFLTHYLWINEKNFKKSVLPVYLTYFPWLQGEFMVARKHRKEKINWMMMKSRCQYQIQGEGNDFDGRINISRGEILNNAIHALNLAARKLKSNVSKVQSSDDQSNKNEKNPLYLFSDGNTDQQTKKQEESATLADAVLFAYCYIILTYLGEDEDHISFIVKQHPILMEV